MKRWALIIVGGLVTVGAVVVGIGMALPMAHQASVAFEVGVEPDSVWRLVTAVERFPRWRDDVDRVERLPDVNGMPAWNEIGSSGELPLFIDEREPPSRLVVRIAPGLPFGGTWTYAIESAGPDATRVTITEDGEIYNPVFRFVSRFIIGYEGTLNRYRSAVLEELGPPRVP